MSFAGSPSDPNKESRMKTAVSILTTSLLLLGAGIIWTGSATAVSDGGDAQAAIAADDSSDAAAADTSQTMHGSSGGDKGVGPIENVKLGPLDPSLAGKGKELFENHCSVCHEMNARKIGPPLGDVFHQRTPEFIMNMILDAPKMEKKDAVAGQLLSKYKVAMPQLGLDEKDARAILEYLRQEAAKGGKGAGDPAEGRPEGQKPHTPDQPRESAKR
jgi:mono/diheme cytochrome c family protein